MIDALNAALNYLFENESPHYTNNPKDSGGPTKYGVTLKSYSAYLGRAVTAQEIEELTRPEAAQFYFDRYWKPLACDRITNTAIAICLFDSGVLYGVGTVALLAQEALSSCNMPLKFDGVIGDKTLTGFNAVNADEFLQAFRQLLLDRIDSVVAINAKNEAFRQGWTNRANRLLTLTSIDPQNEEDA